MPIRYAGLCTLTISSASPSYIHASIHSTQTNPTREHYRHTSPTHPPTHHRPTPPTCTCIRAAIPELMTRFSSCLLKGNSPSTRPAMLVTLAAVIRVRGMFLTFLLRLLKSECWPDFTSCDSCVREIFLLFLLKRWMFLLFLLKRANANLTNFSSSDSDMREIFFCYFY